ncbi:MAG TPA: DinB family protein [Chitinophagales bacterium]|nr:DinB family protein [Chitinophagales bacterium]
MKHSEYLIASNYAHQYIDLVEENDLLEAFKNSIRKLQILPIDEYELLHQSSYFPGKWTLNELLQHIIDTERVMSYRALTFARKDLIELPGFNEDSYAMNSHANDKSISELIEELVAVRISSYYLFKSFFNEDVNTVGRVNGHDFSVKSIGFMMIGHEIHHFNIINERYLPLNHS